MSSDSDLKISLQPWIEGADRIEDEVISAHTDGSAQEDDSLHKEL
jgi:hypothetical protein